MIQSSCSRLVNQSLIYSSTEPEYKTVAHMPVVGCTVSHNASVEECLSGCRQKMWRVFLANLGPSLLATELKFRLKWLGSAVLSIAAARWVTWPCSVGLAKRLDRTHVHMTAILLNYKHNIGVSNDDYYRNRNLRVNMRRKTVGLSSGPPPF